MRRFARKLIRAISIRSEVEERRSRSLLNSFEMVASDRDSGRGVGDRNNPFGDVVGIL